MGLAQFAPQIIKWVTGSDKAADAADKVVSIARAVTGKDNGPDALATIQADPVMAMNYRIAVMAQENELDKAYLLDRQSARERDVAMVQAGRYNWRADFLAFLAVGGLIACVWFVARDAGLPERAVNAIMFVAGVLASAVRDVYGYEFGSSRGSQASGDAVRKIATDLSKR
jgi:hypothetical protein